MSREIDPLDEQIISMLQQDGRRTAAEIARALNVPRATIHRRIDGLVSEGFMTIRAYANSQKIGLPVHVWFEICVALDHVMDVSRALQEAKELRWIGIVSGRCSILAEGYFTSPRRLQTFLAERLAHLPGIQTVETLHVLSLEKFNFDWTSMRHAGDGPEFDSIWPNAGKSSDSAVER
jgi:Lrp/AsnC family transcriptional regulator, regulator for asnA, asnC and gidA